MRALTELTPTVNRHSRCLLHADVALARPAAALRRAPGIGAGSRRRARDRQRDGWVAGIRRQTSTSGSRQPPEAGRGPARARTQPAEAEVRSSATTVWQVADAFLIGADHVDEAAQPQQGNDQSEVRHPRKLAAPTQSSQPWSPPPASATLASSQFMPEMLVGVPKNSAPTSISDTYVARSARRADHERNRQRGRRDCLVAEPERAP